VSIPSSEHAGTTGRLPDGYLSSGDDLYWAQPRAIWIQERLPPANDHSDRIVVAVEPPVHGSGGDTSVIVVAPRHPDEPPEASRPAHVHLLVPTKPDWAAATSGPDDLEHAGWGTIYATRAEADAEYEQMREANDATR
jgi:hypothetical protein